MNRTLITASRRLLLRSVVRQSSVSRHVITRSLTQTAVRPIFKGIFRNSSAQDTDNKRQVILDQDHLFHILSKSPIAEMRDRAAIINNSCSFASRLYGSIRQRNTITRDEAWLSSWNGRKLRPFIWRNFETKPTRMLLMAQIRLCQGRPRRRDQMLVEPRELVRDESIDYVYFQKEHLDQVNQLLKRAFWDGIDVSESLLFPEYSIVCLYKRRVIGCAFMTPEAYVTYIAVDPGWGNAGIGQ
ncbi:hypothetical protein RMATCC62417_14932 [Rhizopus microsporus]|nr:hypothetical protein RMATCC62417_14932 [Rhizopus microsporus]